MAEGGVGIIGAGIIGLAVARRLLEVAPDTPVVVVDKEPSVGAHQTGHNSGVVHAGLYYAPGSLKPSCAGAAAPRYGPTARSGACPTSSPASW